MPRPTQSKGLKLDWGAAGAGCESKGLKVGAFDSASNGLKAGAA